MVLSSEKRNCVVFEKLKKLSEVASDLFLKETNCNQEIGSIFTRCIILSHPYSLIHFTLN